MPANPVYSVADVRQIALRNDYREIKFDESTCLISFRKDSTRINVYYTTGTVGTCLNHPTRGKTQLFRRLVVEEDDLEAIFDNPRVHTGTGYYRKNSSQSWKNEQGAFMSDSARRWLYVCESTGIVTDEATLGNVAKCMNSVSTLLWEPKTLPALKNTRYACGSFAAIRELAMEIALQDGALGAVNHSEMRELRDRQERGEAPAVEGLQECHCSNYDMFIKDFGHEVRLLKRDMLKLPRRVRMEVCDWVVGLLMCGYALVDARFDWFTNVDGVGQAHRVYGETFYSKKDELKGMCMAHGILGDDTV
jgi:hypothetical protein